jgi:hypothetical protein
VLYSNYALEAIYQIIVFNKRVDQIVGAAQEYAEKKDTKVKKVISREPLVRFTDATVTWTAEPILKDISFEFEGA